MRNSSITPTDQIHRFSFREAPVRGQWIRLTEVLGAVCSNQPYPANVAALLGEMLAAVTLVADGIKFEGAVTLQSRGPGPLTTVLAECRDRHLLRGIARWPETASLPDGHSVQTLLGQGQLALSLIPRNRENTYQGLVALTDDSLAANLQRYFAESEQLPTWLVFASSADSVTGLLLQRMPGADHATEIQLDQDQTFWEELLILAATVTEQELTTLPAEQLLGRLFAEHARALTLQPAREVTFSCTCNREKTCETLRSLGLNELHELLAEQATINVTCEICGAGYEFDAVDVHLLYALEPPKIH